MSPRAARVLFGVVLASTRLREGVDAFVCSPNIRAGLSAPRFDTAKAWPRALPGAKMQTELRPPDGDDDENDNEATVRAPFGTGAAGLDGADSQTAAAVPLLHRPLPQAVLCAAGYMVHVCILSRRSIQVPGAQIALGWDTAMGLAVLVAAARRRVNRGKPAIPPWLVAEAPEETEPEAAAMANCRQVPAKERFKLLSTCALLLAAPVAFSYAGPIVEVLLSLLVLCGAPLNGPRMMSARLIVEQTLLYLSLGYVVKLRHPKFFSREWVRIRWRAPWLAPALGGYCASLALFNLVEPINQALLPHLAYLPEGIVAKLANPADKSRASLLLASVAPCVGAPLFEELQSRAFILQALTAAMSLRSALLLQGLLFGAQHFQIGLVLPLSVTGWIWGVLYVNSKNLLVPILIHAMWNARIFLGSFLGL